MFGFNITACLDFQTSYYARVSAQYKFVFIDLMILVSYMVE